MTSSPLDTGGPTSAQGSAWEANLTMSQELSNQEPSIDALKTRQANPASFFNDIRASIACQARRRVAHSSAGRVWLVQ